jgi:hypothetical protein
MGLSPRARSESFDWTGVAAVMRAFGSAMRSASAASDNVRKAAMRRYE